MCAHCILCYEIMYAVLFSLYVCSIELYCMYVCNIILYVCMYVQYYIVCMYVLYVCIVMVVYSRLLCLLQVVQEYERAVIFRLGRLLSGGAKGPGK